jgi:hypothetical protein
MANTQAPRDSNRVPVALGVDGSGNTLPLRVDPATGRLLIEIVGVTSVSPPTLPTTLPRDSNRVHVAGAMSGTDVSPLLIDTRNGTLWVDILVE